MLITHSNRVHCDISAHVYNVLWSYLPCFPSLFSPSHTRPLSPHLPSISKSYVYPSSRANVNRLFDHELWEWESQLGFVAQKIEGQGHWAPSSEPRQRVLQLAGLCEALLDTAPKGSYHPTMGCLSRVLLSCWRLHCYFSALSVWEHQQKGGSQEGMCRLLSEEYKVIAKWRQKIDQSPSGGIFWNNHSEAVQG